MDSGWTLAKGIPIARLHGRSTDNSRLSAVHRTVWRYAKYFFIIRIDLVFFLYKFGDFLCKFSYDFSYKFLRLLCVIFSAAKIECKILLQCGDMQDISDGNRWSRFDTQFLLSHSNVCHGGSYSDWTNFQHIAANTRRRNQRPRKSAVDFRLCRFKYNDCILQTYSWNAQSWCDENKKTTNINQKWTSNLKFNQLINKTTGFFLEVNLNVFLLFKIFFAVIIFQSKIYVIN